MNPTEIISRLIQEEIDLRVLDEIHLPYADPASGPAAKFGLGAELFLPAKDRLALRHEVCDFLRDFWNTFPGAVNEFLARDARLTKKFKEDPAELIAADAGKHNVDTGYSAFLFGQLDIGLPHDDVEPYQASVFARRTTQNRLSLVQASMPVCNTASESHVPVLLNAVLRWAQLCQPIHGSAGFTFIVSAGMEQNSVYALQMMKRFPGFDFPTTIDFAMEADTVHNRIKCVNWFTVLDDALVEELGGHAPMRATLEPACTVHSYQGGVVIQAGPHPRLGDVHVGDNPAEYRMVARYTKPIRFEGYRGSLFRVPQGLDKREEALAWVRRFD